MIEVKSKKKKIAKEITVMVNVHLSHKICSKLEFLIWFHLLQFMHIQFRSRSAAITIATNVFAKALKGLEFNLPSILRISFLPAAIFFENRAHFWMEWRSHLFHYLGLKLNSSGRSKYGVKHKQYRNGKKGKMMCKK